MRADALPGHSAVDGLDQAAGGQSGMNPSGPVGMRGKRGRSSVPSIGQPRPGCSIIAAAPICVGGDDQRRAIEGDRANVAQPRRLR
jgi:hypothetical protein